MGCSDKAPVGLKETKEVDDISCIPLTSGNALTRPFHASAIHHVAISHDSKCPSHLHSKPRVVKKIKLRDDMRVSIYAFLFRALSALSHSPAREVLLLPSCLPRPPLPPPLPLPPASAWRRKAPSPWP
eukprot:766584-Hanusia_phi.AAC.4